MTTLLILLAVFLQAGCMLPPRCQFTAEDFDPDGCESFYLGLIELLTQVAYGEVYRPPSEPRGGCTSLRCQGALCRQVLSNGNFEQSLGTGLKEFVGGSNTGKACLADQGAKIFSEMYQWIKLEKVLTPDELADVSRLRVRARAWLNTESPNSKEGALRLKAVTGPSQSTTLLTRETNLSTDADTDTWEPIEIAMTLPAGTDHIIFEIESLTDTLLADYAQVAIDYGNRPPIAYDQVLPVPEDTPILFSPRASDPDGTLNLLSLRTSDPEFGTLVGRDYTPPPNFVGDDPFTYSIADNQGVYSNEATVTLRIYPINDAPLATNDAYEVPDGNLLLVPAPIGILANDIDAEGDTLEAVLVNDVQNGTLSLDPGGSFTYTPGAAFSGLDTFTYRATDGADTSAVASVTLSREETGYDLAIEKTASATSVQRGRLVTFTVTLTNNGPADATNIRVADVMTPFTFEVDGTNTSQGSFTFDPVAGSGTWNAGSLAAGQRATLRISVYAEANLTNMATITNGLGDGDDPGNNEASASVSVQ